MKYEDLLNKLSAPARRALVNEGITDFEKLVTLTEKDLLTFHGMGPKSIPIIRDFMNSAGMKLKENELKEKLSENEGLMEAVDYCE